MRVGGPLQPPGRLVLRGGLLLNRSRECGESTGFMLDRGTQRFYCGGLLLDCGSEFVECRFCLIDASSKASRLGGNLDIAYPSTIADPRQNFRKAKRKRM
jgi:hypothetical protein